METKASLVDSNGGNRSRRPSLSQVLSTLETGEIEFLNSEGPGVRLHPVPAARRAAPRA